MRSVTKRSKYPPPQILRLKQARCFVQTTPFSKKRLRSCLNLATNIWLGCAALPFGILTTYPHCCRQRRTRHSRIERMFGWQVMWEGRLALSEWRSTDSHPKTTLRQSQLPKLQQPVRAVFGVAQDYARMHRERGTRASSLHFPTLSASNSHSATHTLYTTLRRCHNR